MAIAAALGAGACTGNIGTIEVALTAAPGATLLDDADTIRLTLSDPREVRIIRRDGTGDDPSFDLTAHGRLASLSAEAFRDGNLIGYGSTPAFPFSAIDAGAYLEQVATALPALKPFFQEAERASGVDWRLIAAIGYQESHWDAKATSPTGVRGLMMLTEETADRLQIKDRLDARESILGGARYFALLREALPPRIGEPDRTWLALAAYNIGLGHLEDARILAQKANLNPDKWQDVRQVIPKLADPESFGSLKHGYARGGEAMQLVDSIRNYYDVLARVERRDSPMLPPEVDAQVSTRGSAPGK